MRGCCLLSGSPALPPAAVTLYAFERGAVLAHARIGPLLLRFDSSAAPRAVTFHDGGGDDGYRKCPSRASHLIHTLTR